MNEYNSLLAKKLKELRVEKNAKQTDLATALNISQQGYSLLEAGKTNFTATMVTKLCAFFEVTVDEFLNTGKSVKIIDSPQANSTIGKYTYTHNDTALIKELLATKDMVICSLQAQVALLSGK